jgi:hypothetical protein
MGSATDSPNRIERIAVALREGSEKDAELYALTLEKWVLKGND